MNKIWKDFNEPSDTSLIWQRLNENGHIVAYFQYKNGEWIVINKKDLKKLEDASAFDSLINGAPEELDTLGEIATALSSKEDKISGKGLSTNDYTDEDKTKVENAYIKPANGIPASDLASGVIPDVSQFITKSVNDLANYYLKSETFTKEEVQNLIGAIQQFHYEIYAFRSEVMSPVSNVLYLIGPTGSGADKYEEYVYDATKQEPWVKIGDTTIDLSGYVTTQALNAALANYTTTADLTTLLAGKQDKIDSTHKLDYLLLDNTPAIPDAVEANPTVPSGTTLTDLTRLKVGYNYFSVPAITALTNNEIDTIWNASMN